MAALRKLAACLRSNEALNKVVLRASGLSTVYGSQQFPEKLPLTLSSGRYWEEWSRAVSQVIKTHEWTGEMSKASFDEVRTVPQYATCSRAQPVQGRRPQVPFGVAQNQLKLKIWGSFLIA